jgi:hypothetical protein
MYDIPLFLDSMQHKFCRPFKSVIKHCHHPVAQDSVAWKGHTRASTHTYPPHNMYDDGLKAEIKIQFKLELNFTKTKIHSKTYKLISIVPPPVKSMNQ